MSGSCWPVQLMKCNTDRYSETARRRQAYMQTNGRIYLYTHDVFTRVQDRKSVLRGIALFSHSLWQDGPVQLVNKPHSVQWTPRREFPWQNYWFYGFLPKVVIMIHHGWIWQARRLGKRWQTNLQLYGLRGDFDYRHLQRNITWKRDALFRLHVSGSFPLPSPSLGVSFPSVSIWMYELVTGTMDWLCCFV